jgi:hypothetical protein
MNFIPKNVHIRSMLFELNADVAPNWFGVAVPDGIADFTRPTIFFHPTPGPAGYVDGPTPGSEATYFGKSKPKALRTPAESKWHELYAYIDRLGQQLAAAVLAGATPDQVVILPFMTTKRMPTAGILPANWLPIVTDIMIGVRAAVTGVVAPLTISEVVLAGYSAGWGTMMALRTSSSAAPTLNPRLKQILDMDGFPKSSSNPVVTTPSVKVWKYVEVSAGTPDTIIVPRPRWDNYPQPAPDEEPELPTEKNSDGTIADTLFVHHLIRDSMFLDAALKR